MDFKFLVKTIKNIIVNTEYEWDTIVTENRTSRFISLNLLLPLIIPASLSAYLGSLLFIDTGLNQIYSVLTGLKYFLLFFAVVYLTAVLLKEVLRRYGSDAGFEYAFKITALSSVPLLLCQIISRLFESFIFVNVLALYGIYICWAGIDRLAGLPKKKKYQLLLIATALYIAVWLISNRFLRFVAEKIYYSLFA